MAAVTESPIVPNTQPTTLTEGGQTVFAPSREQALSLPQSEWTQSEIAFPQRSGGARSLTGTAPAPGQTATVGTALTRAQELDEAVRQLAGREAALGGRAAVGGAVPTPAERLALSRDYARSVGQSPAGRPGTPGVLSEGMDVTLTQPYARAWEMMFPEDMQTLRNLHGEGQRLYQTRTGQIGEGYNLRDAIKATGGEITPQIRAQMDAIDAAHRRFSAGNDPYVRNLADLPRSNVQTARQRMIMEDVQRNAGRAGTTFWDPVVQAHPVAESVGMRPDQFAHAMRDPRIFEAAARRDPQLERLLRDRLDVMQMAE